MNRNVLRRGRALGWGFVGQACSSATNFGLTLLAGRVGGPSGLGTVFIGFSAYLILLGLQRRLLYEPLVSLTSAAPEEERAAVARSGLVVAIASAIAAAAAVAMAGAVVPGFAGDGLLLIAPWLAPALLQDLWRHLLFRDKRAAAAAANDATWLLVMVALVPVALEVRTDWAVMGTWGMGAVAGAVLGGFQTRTRPARIREGWRWWRIDAWPFGRWNAGAGIVTNVGTNATALVVSGIIGSAALGGIRAAQSIFAPLTLVIPAITLPGLPALGRALSRSLDDARRLAVRLSAVAIATASTYLLVLVLGGWRLLPVLFGDEFDAYRELLWPIAVGQLFTATGVGALLLIKAERRGRELLTARAIGAAAGLCAVAVLALRYGVLGAAWGGAGGALVSTVLLVRTATRRGEPRGLQPDPNDTEAPAET